MVTLLVILVLSSLISLWACQDEHERRAPSPPAYHPQGEALERYAACLVGEDEMDTIEQHLDHCPTCRGRVAAMARPSVWVAPARVLVPLLFVVTGAGAPPEYVRPSCPAAIEEADEPKLLRVAEWAAGLPQHLRAEADVRIAARRAALAAKAAKAQEEAARVEKLVQERMQAAGGAA